MFDIVVGKTPLNLVSTALISWIHYTSVDLGIYIGLTSAGGSIFVLIVSQIWKYYKLSDDLNLVLSVLSAFVGPFILAFSYASWLFYLCKYELNVCGMLAQYNHIKSYQSGRLQWPR